MQVLGDEEGLMLGLARAGTEGVRSTRKIDARRVRELAAYHRMLPEASEACCRIEEEVPGTVMHLDTLVEAAEKQVLITRERVQAGATVLAALRERMPVMLAKGLYMRDVAKLCSARRTMGDLDVYIAEENVDEALAVCARFGAVPNVSVPRRKLYRRSRGQFAVEGGHVSIDLHWWLNNNPLHRDASGFNLEAVWRSGRQIQWQGIPLLVPSPADALLLNAIYMTYQNWGHVLRMYVDHKALANAVDPAHAVQRAKDVGLVKVLVTTLQAASVVAGLSLDEAWRGSLADCASLHRYREAFAVVTDGPGAPSPLTRWKEESIKRRRHLNRFFIRIDEYTRVLRLSEKEHQLGALRTLLWPGRRFSQFYLTEHRRAWLLHPAALAMGAGALAWRALQAAAPASGP
jgi:hypothetical protein